LSSIIIFNPLKTPQVCQQLSKKIGNEVTVNLGSGQWTETKPN